MFEIVACGLEKQGVELFFNQRMQIVYKSPALSLARVCLFVIYGKINKKPLQFSENMFHNESM